MLITRFSSHHFFLQGIEQYNKLGILKLDHNILMLQKKSRLPGITSVKKKKKNMYKLLQNEINIITYNSIYENLCLKETLNKDTQSPLKTRTDVTMLQIKILLKFEDQSMQEMKRDRESAKRNNIPFSHSNIFSLTCRNWRLWGIIWYMERNWQPRPLQETA